MKLSLLLLISLSASAATSNYDVVVYGATAGGVATAVSAAREGLRVALIEPRRHIGGMASGGLQRTDVGRREVIGGLALEFYFRAGKHYESIRFLNEIAWFMEAFVAERIFNEMLQEAGVTVIRNHFLKEKTGVKKLNGKITSIETVNGDIFTAKIFADATYEGDLMAQAGVSYTWGRESSKQYNEPLAGVRVDTPKHQFTVKLTGKDSAGTLLPEIQPEPLGKEGDGDKKVQAYNFRLVLSSDRANQVPFPKPRNYDSNRFELFAQLLTALERKAGRPLHYREFFNTNVIPNNKADFNNHGAFSTDYLGKSWDYPEASYVRRNEIWQDHIDYTQGLFYFLAHDPRVPASLQTDINGWGLSRDEFQDTNHWPHQLYVREARRMIGEYVMTQKDIQTARTKPDAIGMGSYNSDSHNVQRVIGPDGFVFNEGDMQVPVQPYQIPYRMITPKRNEVTNLLVPVCFSASHVAYSTLRMEPQYMIIGQASGVAAKMAIDKSLAVQDVDPTRLTQALRSLGAILEYHPDPLGPSLSKFRNRLIVTPPRVQ